MPHTHDTPLNRRTFLTSATAASLGLAVSVHTSHAFAQTPAASPAAAMACDFTSDVIVVNAEMAPASDVPVITREGDGRVWFSCPGASDPVKLADDSDWIQATGQPRVVDLTGEGSATHLPVPDGVNADTTNAFIVGMSPDGQVVTLAVDTNDPPTTRAVESGDITNQRWMLSEDGTWQEIPYEGAPDGRSAITWVPAPVSGTPTPIASPVATPVAWSPEFVR